MKISTMTSIGAAAVAVAGMTATTEAEVIAQWTFETSAPAATNSATITGINPEVGAGTASGVHASSDTDYSNPVGNGSGESFSSNTWAVGDYYQFEVSTVGFTDVTLSWDQTRSSTGPATFDLAYSTDGTNFTVFTDDYTVPAVSWSSTTPDATGTTSFTADLSSISALDNDSSVFFRLVADAAPGSTGGTNRVDNFTVNGVPEPASLALLALGGLATLGRRRA